MNLADVFIVLVLVLGLLFGLNRGFIRPAISQAGSILVLVILVTRPDLLDSVVPHAVPRLFAVAVIVLVAGILIGIVARVIVGIAYAVPLVKPLDKLAGMVFNAALAFLLLYLLLSALVTLDEVLQPIHRVSRLGPAQVAELQKSLGQSPITALFIDRKSIDALAKASRGTPVAVGSLGSYDGWLGSYENKVRPELAGSRLAPAGAADREQLPIIGHHQELPQAEARTEPAR